VMLVGRCSTWNINEYTHNTIPEARFARSCRVVLRRSYEMQNDSSIIGLYTKL
jgi:hypothetical protein